MNMVFTQKRFIKGLALLLVGILALESAPYSEALSPQKGTAVRQWNSIPHPSTTETGPTDIPVQPQQWAARDVAGTFIMIGVFIKWVALFLLKGYGVVIGAIIVGKVLVWGSQQFHDRLDQWYGSSYVPWFAESSDKFVTLSGRLALLRPYVSWSLAKVFYFGNAQQRESAVWQLGRMGLWSL